MKIAPAAAGILDIAFAALAHENKRDEPGSASHAEPDWREWPPVGSRKMDNGNTDLGYIGLPGWTQPAKEPVSIPTIERALRLQFIRIELRRVSGQEI